MKIEIDSASPDGMTVKYTTFLMTWADLDDFLKFVAKIEGRGKNKK